MTHEPDAGLYPPPPGGPYPPPPPPGVPYSAYRPTSPGHAEAGAVAAAPLAAPVAPRVSGLAIASLVLGILWIYWVGSILALIFGYVAKSQIDKSHGTQTGRGMAVAGIVLGWVGVGFLTLIIVLSIVSAATSDPNPNSF